MCCREKRRESDMVPRETQPGRRAKGGYGEGPDLHQEEVFMKEVVMAQHFDE